MTISFEPCWHWQTAYKLNLFSLFYLQQFFLQYDHAVHHPKILFNILRLNYVHSVFPAPDSPKDKMNVLVSPPMKTLDWSVETLRRV